MFIRQATFLHISDLHIGTDLNSVPTDNQYSECFKRLGLVCGSHDPEILASFEAQVRQIEIEPVVRGCEPRGKIDAVFLTGDILTDPKSSESYRLIFQHLTNEGTTAQLGPGLKFPPANIFSVPGNHDKLVEPTLEKYLSSPFAPLEKYRLNDFGDYIVLFKSVRSDLSGFLIYGMNSSRLWPRNIAAGEITTTQLNSVVEALRAILVDHRSFAKGMTVYRNGQVEDGIDINPMGVIATILLIHHHPYLLRARDLTPLRRHYRYAKDLLLSIENQEQLWQRAGIYFDVILHGHLHKSLLYDFQDIPQSYLDDRKTLSHRYVIGCGTTMEWNHRRQGQAFNVVDFGYRDSGAYGFMLSTYKRERSFGRDPHFIKYVWRRKRGKYVMVREKSSESGDFIPVRGDTERLLEKIDASTRRLV